MKVLHITPHLGGGIGSAYAGITIPCEDCSVQHEVVLLEQPQKNIFVDRVRGNGCPVSMVPPRNDLIRLLEQADIVQLNWWHHPLMCRFFYEFPEIPVRIVGWMHCSGCTYPYLRTVLLKKFHKSFFTTPFSYENAEIAVWEKEDRDRRTGVVFGMGDASRFFPVQPTPHQGFRIGYMGTLEFSKLHSQFLEFCVEAGKVGDDVTFVLIGDCGNKDILLEQAAKYGISDKLEFKGFCSDIGKEFSELDCMGYLLNPYHFGASENVILETMASGVPIITLNQNTEKYLLTDRETGFLVNDKYEYRQVIDKLYRSSTKRTKIGENAKKRIREKFDAKANQVKLYEYYHEVMQEEKRVVDFKDAFGPTPSDWFLSAVNEERELFLNNRLEDIPEIFKGESKSSVRHFLSYYPKNERFVRWNRQIRQ